MIDFCHFKGKRGSPLVTAVVLMIAAAVFISTIVFLTQTPASVPNTINEIKCPCDCYFNS